MIYFAWIDPDEAFNSVTHSREDENVFGFELGHSEGDFAMLSVDIKNPRANLLGPGRKQWIWFSQDGTPLFKGRLVAVPEGLNKEIARLNFVARPADFQSVKAALAETLKVAPFWDPIWVNDQRLDDPDVVLEARPELWHVDRVSHAVTTSNITTGEDGTIEFNQFYDGLDIQYGAAPLRRVKVKATISWDQSANDRLDFTPGLLKAFELAGSPPHFVSSLTGQGLESDWPKRSDNLDGGWAVGKVSLQRVDGISRSARSVLVTVQGTSGNGGADDSLDPPIKAEFFIWEFKPQFPLKYDVARKRVENVKFTLESDVQPLIVDPGEDDIEIVTLSTQAVGEGDPPPIGDLRRKSYLVTDRGVQSFEYLLMLARAKLLARARAVNIKATMPFATGLAMSCRKNGHVTDPRLPDGEATGKIIEYRLVKNGDSGEQYCEATIGCTIGEGNTIDEVLGTPTYCVASYVGDDYQIFVGGEANVGGINYEDYRDTVIDDDGIDLIHLEAKDVTLKFNVYNGETIQKNVLSGTFQDIPAAIEALNAQFTEVELELKPLEGGPFETNFNVDVSKLMIPKTMVL